MTVCRIGCPRLPACVCRLSVLVPAAHRDIPHFRVHNSNRAGIMEEFQGREGRVAHRLSFANPSSGAVGWPILGGPGAGSTGEQRAHEVRRDGTAGTENHIYLGDRNISASRKRPNFFPVGQMGKLVSPDRRSLSRTGNSVRAMRSRYERTAISRSTVTPALEIFMRR